MRTFRIALLFPLLVLMWLVTTASMCPTDGPTSTDGRTADVGGYMEISPSSPRPMQPITLNAAALETTGNPDAYSTWAFAIYRGDATSYAGDEFNPAFTHTLVDYIREEDPYGPGESATQRIVQLPEGGYTVVYYMSASTQFKTSNRSAMQTFNVADCRFVSAQALHYPDTLTAGNGPGLQFRDLPDTGHLLSPIPVEEEGKLRAFVGEETFWSVTNVFRPVNPPFTYTLLDSSDQPTGLTLNARGEIRGTPVAGSEGEHWMRILVSDSCDAPWFMDFRIPIIISNALCPPVTLNSITTLPPAILNEPYTAAITPAGGTPPFTLAITSGTLPPGLTLTNTGISGTPTVAGSSQVSIRVTDTCLLGDPRTTLGTFNIDVFDPANCPALVMNATILPAGTQGITYAAPIPVSGGLPPVAITLTSGALPAGIMLDSAGAQLTGTPTGTGSFTITLQATDSCDAQQTREQEYELVINEAATCAAAPDLQITGLPSGTVGAAYNVGVSASGGEGALTFSSSGAGLPPGLTMSTGGTISGTPLSDGTFTFTVEVDDSCVPAQSDSQETSITIAPAAGCAAAPNLAITGLPSGIVGSAYSTGVSASDGEGVLSFSIASGNLPDGLGMTSQGQISGTPTLDGTFIFTIGVSDSCVPAQSDEQEVSITIAPDGSSCQEMFLNPLTVDDATVGVFYEHFFGEWVSGGEGDKSFFIAAPTQPPPGMTIDQDSGTLSGTPTTPGVYQFILQVRDECVPPQDEQEIITLTVN